MISSSTEQTALREVETSSYWEQGAYGFGILTGLASGVYAGTQIFQDPSTAKSDWVVLGTSITLIGIASFALYKPYSQISSPEKKDLTAVVTLISPEVLPAEENTALNLQIVNLQNQIFRLEEELLNEKEYGNLSSSYYQNQIALVTQLLTGVNLEQKTELTPEMINNFERAKAILTTLAQNSNSSAASSTTTSTFTSTVHTPSKKTPAPSPFSTPVSRTRP